MLKWLVFPILMLNARAADPFEQWAPKPAEHWHDAFPLKAGPWGGRMFGGTSQERIAMFRAAPGFDGLNSHGARLDLNWLNPEPPAGYRRSMDRATGIATVSFDRSGSRITESVFLSKAESLLVVHLLSDKPGALDFQVSLTLPGGAEYRVKDRRELDAEGLRVWVLPFESDVESSGQGLAVRGEGEALILLALGSRQELNERLGALGRKYDGRESFPDLTKVWAGLLDAKLHEHD